MSGDIDLQARQFMLEKIYDSIIQWHPQPINDMQEKKIRNIARRLEEGLYKLPTSKEDYTNLDTLETRIQNLIKRPLVNSQNQQYSTQFVNNNPIPVRAITPNPGRQQIGASKMMVVNSVMPRRDIDIPTRQVMLKKIYGVVIQWHPQPINDVQKKKFRNIVRRLEEGLYRLSTSKEEYMNLDTLETRIQNLIKRPLR